MKYIFATLSTLSLIIFLHPFLIANAQVSETVNITAVVQDVTNGGCGNNCNTGGNTYGTGGIFTGVRFIGRAYPMSDVTILKDGQYITSVIAGLDARFEVLLSGISPSTYTFSVHSEDSFGRRSVLYTFPLVITRGMFATVSGIFLAPTLEIQKRQIKQGETLIVEGQTVPSSNVTISLGSSFDQQMYQVPTDQSGIYKFNLNTVGLNKGNYSIKSKAIYSNEVSQFGKVTYFRIADTSSTDYFLENRYSIADLNKDGHVNIIDFSIMNFWYKENSPPVYVDLTKDGVVSLADFSIMAFYWTG